MTITSNATATLLKIDAVVKNLGYMFGKGTNGVTPFTLCLELVDKTIDFSNFDQKIIDPACGKGSFLLAVIKRFIETGCPVDHAVNMVYGIDHCKSQCDHARVNIQRATGLSVHLECADSLTKEFNMKFDAVIGNPPYGKNSNLAVSFTNKALELSDLVAFVCPRTLSESAAVHNRVDPNAEITEYDQLPDNTFHIPIFTSTYVWKKTDTARPPMVRYEKKELEPELILTKPGTATVCVGRVGAGPSGKVFTDRFDERSPNSHYFFIANAPEVIDNLKSLQQEFIAAARNGVVSTPSLSLTNLVSIYRGKYPSD